MPYVWINNESPTILDAVQEDIRHAVDVAASYLPENVAGAIGSVLRTFSSFFGLNSAHAVFHSSCRDDEHRRNEQDSRVRSSLILACQSILEEG